MAVGVPSPSPVKRFIFDFLLIFRRKPSKDYIRRFEEIRTDGFKAYVKLAKKPGVKRFGLMVRIR